MSRPVLRSPQRHAHARILGIGGVRGDRVVPNDDIVGPIDSSDEWIRQRTGIIERRRATEEQTLQAMTEEAARRALEAAGVEGSQLGAVIVATVTHLEATPALATRVADSIGATPAAAYDISAACAGYCYGIAQADALVRAGTVDYVLVVGAERMSDVIDPTDRSISFILGDGAGAAVVGPSETPGIGPTVWGSDGSQADAVDMTHSWLAVKDGTDTSWPTLRQKGPTVFKWASFEMAKAATAAIEAAGLQPEDIEVFLPHQANMRIIDMLAKRIGLAESVVIARDIAETGNTSAASIPLAAERLQREGAVESGALALQIGFGAGLAYAAQVVALP